MRAVIAISITIGCCLLSYLFGAFVAADFNIINWGQDGRFFVASGAVGGSIALNLIAHDLRK